MAAAAAAAAATLRTPGDCCCLGRSQLGPSDPATVLLLLPRHILSHRRPIQPRVTECLQYALSLAVTAALAPPDRGAPEVALHSRMRLILSASRDGMRCMPHDQHGCKASDRVRFRTSIAGIAGHRGSAAAGRAAIALTVARHQLHESWFRPHLPIRRTLRPLSELLAHKIGIMPYAVPIRRVEVFARPERPTRSDRPAFCPLRTEELLHRQVRPAEHPDLPRAQIVVAGRFVRFNRDAGPPLGLMVAPAPRRPGAARTARPQPAH